jgi:hypothetical protein
MLRAGQGPELHPGTAHPPGHPTMDQLPGHVSMSHLSRPPHLRDLRTPQTRKVLETRIRYRAYGGRGRLYKALHRLSLAMRIRRESRAALAGEDLPMAVVLQSVHHHRSNGVRQARPLRLALERKKRGRTWFGP